MGAYVFRRILQTILVAFAAVIVIFVLVRLSGDPAALIAGPSATQEDVEQIRHQLGFDKPMAVQLADYLRQAAKGDLGESIRYQEPAVQVSVERIPATLELTGAAMALSLLVAIPAGIISATRRNSLIDRVTMVFAVVGQTMPVFWLGIILIVVFAVQLHWLPTGGRGTPQQLIMPAITLALFNMARIARLVRSEMLDVIGNEYIQVARSKGLSERLVILRHALRNAAIPVVTIIGLQVGQLLGGAVVTETVFAWPGVGRLMVDAIHYRDYPIIQTVVLMMAITVAVINLLVDLSYAWLDPRVRYS
ncbi:MAG TPA: ABC transporter permease [Thermomicrobiaceae bacterium]|nr:ABC transporter permease [Thermomicrobiaceae bacterium]